MSDDRDYPVGKGRPPKHSQWRPGQTGNPKGPPRRAKAAIPHEKLLGRMVTVTVDGVECEMRADGALVMRIFEEAALGGRVSIRRAMQRALAQFEQYKTRQRRQTIVIGRAVETGCVDEALEYLGMASRLDIYRPSCRLLLEPWVVEAALAIRDGNKFTLDEQKRIYSVTRSPHKVKWPPWWDLASCESYRPKIVIPEVAPWTII